MFKKEVVIVVVLLFLILLTSCSVPLEKQCETVNDCSPDECCHASDTVNNDFAPDCGGVFCTEECAPGTLDCGQGEIVCAQGKCAVVLKKL